MLLDLVRECFSELGAGSGFTLGRGFKRSDELVKAAANLDGVSCFGDQGGQLLLADTGTMLAVNCYVTDGNCVRVTHSSRVDIPEVLDWITSF